MRVALLSVSCQKKSADTTSSAPAKPAAVRIAVIPKGTTHEFWKAVHAGAVKAARELKVDIVWKKGRSRRVRSEVAGRLGAELHCPGRVGHRARSARRHGVGGTGEGGGRRADPGRDFRFWILKDKSYVSFVATDNHAAGALAGERMGKLLNGKGNVLVLRYLEGSASTTNREQGFLEGDRQVPRHQGRIRPIATPDRRPRARTHATWREPALGAKRAAKGTINGIFTPNESTTFGMLLALQKAELAGKVRFIGFDSSEKLVAGVSSGQIDALVLQDPMKMGLPRGQSHRFALAEAAGVEARIDTGATLVDKVNLQNPAIAELVKPSLAQWLDAP